MTLVRPGSLGHVAHKFHFLRHLLEMTIAMMVGISQTDLVGYSYGGFAALNYAMLAPNRLNKLILLSPAGGFVRLRTQFFIRGMLSSLVPSVGWANPKDWRAAKSGLDPMLLS